MSKFIHSIDLRPRQEDATLSGGSAPPLSQALPHDLRDGGTKDSLTWAWARPLFQTVSHVPRGLLSRWPKAHTGLFPGTRPVLASFRETTGAFTLESETR